MGCLPSMKPSTISSSSMMSVQPGITQHTMLCACNIYNHTTQGVKYITSSHVASLLHSPLSKQGRSCFATRRLPAEAQHSASSSTPAPVPCLCCHLTCCRSHTSLHVACPSRLGQAAPVAVAGPSCVCPDSLRAHSNASWLSCHCVETGTGKDQ
jgi:hypothetical protein